MQILNVCLCCREGEWGENKRNPWENLNRKQIADDGGWGIGLEEVGKIEKD